ncbi:hypothetical protein B0H13DRAFT_2672063 [Mycena leptocephala]|nr:hypothetical protein B0H13DRAFT_2672063 [Mycena leptocephala]
MSGLARLRKVIGGHTSSAAAYIIAKSRCDARMRHLLCIPLRLTRVLAAAITETEKAYLQALETGLLSPSDVNTAEMLATLQLKVSTIREATLSNSLSVYATLREFLTGRTLVIVRCIWEVHALKTHIEILKEAQLRADGSDLVPLRWGILRF